MNPRQNQLNRTLRQFYDRPVAKVSLELVFSLLAVIFFALFAIRPTLVTMSDLVKEINDKTALDNRLKEKIASLTSAKDEFEASEPRFAVLEQAIPGTPRFEEALLLIEKTASNYKLPITAIQLREIPKGSITAPNGSPPTPELAPPSAVTSTDNPQAAAGSIAVKPKRVRLSKPVSITVEGEYPTIRAFITDLGNLQRQLTVDAISFQVTDELSKKKLRATLTISIQYFGEEATTTPAGASTGSAPLPVPAPAK